MALFKGKNGIERATFVVAAVSTHEKDIFVKGGFSKISLSITEAVCSVTITTQETMTCVTFRQILSQLHNILCNN